MPHLSAPSIPAPAVEQAWLKLVQAQVEASLLELLELPDESRLDTRWTRTLEQVREYVLRPNRRVRPALLLAGYCLARGSAAVPAGLWRFAAGVELLHTYLVIHDDVTGQAALRHGGLALHHLLAPGRVGQDLAVVVGDHLFARALETMLGSGLPGSARATQYYLRVFRHTTVGQYLDMGLSPLGEVSVTRALRVARLKTARQGFCAPLPCGAMLAGADRGLQLRLARVGDQAGLAWQLRQDVSCLFENARASGMMADCDFTQGRRSFPVVAAWARATPEVRRELEALWALPPERKDEVTRGRARRLVDEAGGRVATERLVARASREAVRVLETLPNPNGLRDLMRALVGQLASPMS
ncbi:MAG TPA: polyprenyl synthetase family protein [Myxococcus sp.]|nr:polyprenyl synthetase family protein [Myxococcus sp.]